MDIMASSFTTHHVIKKNNSTFPWGILIACILFFSFLLWSKWDKITHFFSNTTSLTNSLDDIWFVVGNPITLEWEIRSDWDFITHTHTLLTQSSGVFGLKSKTVNLSQFSGMISIDGTVALNNNDLVIIEVVSVMDLNPKQITGVVLTGSNITWQAITGDIPPVLPTWASQVAPSATVVTWTVQSIWNQGTKKLLSVQEGLQQFPVTIWTGTSFVSSRWHSILFPSKKISFQGLNLAATDFGIKGLRCYSQINVVAYANKANITTAPSVKIFECTSKTDTVPAQFASIALDDGRVFLIEATDPAWGDFANAVEITEVATTN